MGARGTAPSPHDTDDLTGDTDEDEDRQRERAERFGLSDFVELED